MELFRINSKVIIRGDVVHAYLCYTVLAIPKQLMGTAQDVIMLITSVNRFSTVLTDKLK
jgi:hypothetical protein